MNQFLKKTALALGASLVMAAAQAGTTTTITFEPGALDSSGAAFAPLLTDQDTLLQNGVGIVVLDNNNPLDDPSGGLTGAIVDGNAIGETCAGLICPTNNKTTFLLGNNDAVFAVLAANGTDKVSLNSLSLSFIGAGGQPLQATPAVVEIGGFKNGTYQFVRANLSSNGVTTSFASLSLAGSVLATQSFDYIYIFTYACDSSGACSSRGTDGNQFAIDDLSVTLTAAVPEPAEWALLPLGLVALAGIARRRRAAQAA